MNKNKLSIALLALLLISATSLSAQIKFNKPRSNQVVLIGKCMNTTPLNEPFYARYFIINKNTTEHGIWSGLGSKYGVIERVGTLNSYFYIVANLPENRILKVPGVKLFLFNNSYSEIYLPMNIEITVPEGEQYIYLGTVAYEFSDMYFNIKDINLIDEFDETQAYLDANSKNKITMIRAPIKSTVKE